jgi:hypothetical protein
MAGPYDLSSLVTLEAVVAQMVRDDAAAPTTFSGGAEDAATAVAGGPAVGTTVGRFTATYGAGINTDLQDTTILLRNRLRALIMVLDSNLSY